MRGVLIDLQNGKTEPLAVPNPQTAIMDGSGNVLVANSEPGVVTVYDRATGAKRSVIDRRPNKVEQWHFVPAGERLAVVVASDKTEAQGPGTCQIEICDVATGKVQRAIQVPGDGMRSMALSGDGRMLAWIGSRNGVIQVYETETGKEVARLSISSRLGIGAMALDGEGTHLAWSESGWNSSEPNSVRIVSVATGEMVDQLWCQAPAIINRLSYTPDGKFLLAQNGSGLGEGPRLRIWETATGKLVLWLPSRDFAAGSGPRGEIVIVRRQNGREAGTPAIDLVRPTEVLSELDHAGLTTCLKASDPEYRTWMGGNLFVNVIPWSFGLTFVAFIIFYAVAIPRLQKGLPILPKVGLLAALAADVGGLFSLRQLLALFDRPDWNVGDLFLEGIFNVFAMIIAALLTWDAVRHYRSRIYGEKLPIYKGPMPEEMPRFMGIWKKSFGWFLASLFVFEGIAYLDGFAKIGLLGFCVFGLLFQVLLSAFFATTLFSPTAFHVQRAVDRWKKSHPQVGVVPEQGPAGLRRKTLGRLALLVIVLGFFTMEIVRRIASGSWPRIKAPDESGDFIFTFGLGQGAQSLSTITTSAAALVVFATAVGLWRTLAASRAVPEVSSSRSV